MTSLVWDFINTKKDVGSNYELGRLLIINTTLIGKGALQTIGDRKKKTKPAQQWSGRRI